MPPFTSEIKKIFTKDGTLSQVLPGHELRPGQLKMALAVMQTLDKERPEEDFSPVKLPLQQANMLVVEAETGIGKTLAYLVPAMLSGQRVVVSTGTLNLQEQILKKEIPFIQKYLNPNLKAVCVKGRQNYVCLYRCQQLLSTPQMNLFQRSEEIELLQEWLFTTDSGDRSELTWLPDKSDLWEQVSSATSKCLGVRCPDNASCFITKLRKKAGQSQIIIVNHHLFFSDLAIRRFGHAEVLPRYQTVIFDEAHHIENIATRYFGETFSHYQLLDLVKDIEKTAEQFLTPDNRKKTVQIARSLAAQANIFSAIFPKERGRFPLPEIIEQTPEWNQELIELKSSLENLSRHLDADSLNGEQWEAPRRRVQELLASLINTTSDMISTNVYWYERREKTITLSASPIEVAAALQDHLYSTVNSIIFTSATLATGDSFSYMFKRLGLGKDVQSLSLASPFDYKSRTRLFVPADGFPEPNHAKYANEITARTCDIINASKGRALLLFTSFYAMNQMYNYLQENLSYPILRQGDAPKNILLDTFQHQETSVLLAVASFWEGVNVPGNSLSCVIIDKLPFEVPTDPVIMARIHRIEEEGGKAFFEFQVPRAILALRQGVGRLMRAATDHGLLAIMDIRLYSKGYGKIFLKSMPDSPIIRDMPQVKKFFKERSCEQ